MANADKPNILAIWGDDIGLTDLSCYSDGLMRYRIPNIDRIAREGRQAGRWQPNTTDTFAEFPPPAETGQL